MGPLLTSSRTDIYETTQQDPRSLGHRWTKGVGGSPSLTPGAVCLHTREST